MSKTPVLHRNVMALDYDDEKEAFIKLLIILSVLNAEIHGVLSRDVWTSDVAKKSRETLQFLVGMGAKGAVQMHLDRNPQEKIVFMGGQAHVLPVDLLPYYDYASLGKTDFTVDVLKVGDIEIPIPPRLQVPQMFVSPESITLADYAAHNIKLLIFSPRGKKQINFIEKRLARDSEFY